MTVDKAKAKFPLLQPSLEGLARFGHSVSVEYFSDLLAVMQTLLASPRLPLPQRLQTLLTASSLLKSGPAPLHSPMSCLAQMQPLAHGCLPPRLVVGSQG